MSGIGHAQEVLLNSKDEFGWLIFLQHHSINLFLATFVSSKPDRCS